MEELSILNYSIKGDETILVDKKVDFKKLTILLDKDPLIVDIMLEIFITEKNSYIDKIKESHLGHIWVTKACE